MGNTFGREGIVDRFESARFVVEVAWARTRWRWRCAARRGCATRVRRVFLALRPGH